MRSFGSLERDVAQGATAGLSASCYRTKGERLAYLRQCAGLTIGSAAERTGISSSELSRIENDRRRLTRKHVAAFAEAYRLDPKTLHEILEFTPAHEFVKYRDSSGNGEKRHAGQSQVPSYLSKMITGIGLSVRHNDRFSVPEGLVMGPLSYAIRIMEDEAGDLFQPETHLLVDPEARVVLGDMVVNTSTWTPLIVSLARTGSGALVGRSARDTAHFPPSALVSSFHKVIAVFFP